MRHGTDYTNAARLTLANDGGTFTLTGAQVLHRRGYYVGGLVPTAIVRKHENDAWSLSWLAEQLASFARQHKAVLENADAYLGTWVNEGNVYIDVAQWVGDRGTALGLGHARGELAVWDCERGEEVTL